MKIDETVIARSPRWTSEIETDGEMEWRVDRHDGRVVQVLCRPLGHTQWHKPYELLQLREAQTTGKERDK